MVDRCRANPSDSPVGDVLIASCLIDAAAGDRIVMEMSGEPFLAQSRRPSPVSGGVAVHDAWAPTTPTSAVTRAATGDAVFTPASRVHRIAPQPTTHAPQLCHTAPTFTTGTSPPSRRRRLTPVLVVVGLYGAASWLDHMASLSATAPATGAVVLAPLAGLLVLPEVVRDLPAATPARRQGGARGSERSRGCRLRRTRAGGTAGAGGDVSVRAPPSSACLPVWCRPRRGSRWESAGTPSRSPPRPIPTSPFRSSGTRGCSGTESPGCS